MSHRQFTQLEINPVSNCEATRNIANIAAFLKPIQWKTNKHITITITIVTLPWMGYFRR